MHINDQEEIVQTGQSVYIPFNACQWIKNIGEEDLKFLCTVSPPWKNRRKTVLIIDPTWIVVW